MNILVISPAFPPMTSVGVVRMASLVTYLQGQGDNVTVVCELPTKENTNGAGVVVPGGIEIVHVDSAKFSDKQKAQIYSDAIGELLKTRTFDVALATLGPYFSLRFCYKLFRKYALKYILDFRDVGAFEAFSTNNPLSFMRIVASRMYEAYYEFRSIACAERVVSVTEGWTTKKKRDYFLFAEKMRLISNGFDDLRLKELKKPVVSEKHTIAIMGKLAYYSKEHALMFFSAAKTLSEKYADLKVLHICDKEEDVDDIIARIGFPKEKYVSTGFLDYLEGMNRLQSATVLLIVDKRKDAMGTKLYDYIFTDKPIIYVGPAKTTISNMVSSFENGYSTDCEDQIVRAVSEIFDKDLKVLDTRKTSSNYSRSAQNREYRKLLCECIDAES